MHKGLRFSEKFIYLSYCILTLGFWWAVKIIIKCAILEALKGDWEEDE